MVMATGDNILTEISISKECELIKKNSIVYSCEIEGNKLLWNAIENFDEENDPGEFMIEAKKEGDQNYIVFLDSGKDINSQKKNDLFEKGTKEINTNSGNNNVINDFDININVDDNKLRSSDLNIYKSQNEPTYKSNIFTSALEQNNNPIIDNFPPDRYRILYSRCPSLMVNVPILPSSGKEQINSDIPSGDDSALMGLEIKEYPFQNVQEDYVISMTGKTFETLCTLRDRFIATQNENLRIYQDVFKIILLHGRVFARMAPEHKALLVDGFKKEKLAVWKCGDGAND